MTWLHRFIKFVVASTVLLIAAGGMVTSTDSGLAVPDWPNTYGQFMFSFPLEKMVGGIFYEHGHRMIASTVGFLTIILAIWTWKADPRRWVRQARRHRARGSHPSGPARRHHGPAAAPGTGLDRPRRPRAALLLPHDQPGALHLTRVDERHRRRVDDPTLRRIAVATTVMVYCQILLGATMRHIEAGMAIPDFPLAFGHLVPPSWNAGVAVHFAHRVGAVLVTTAILATAGHVWFHHRTRRELVRPAALLTLFVLTQVSLGAFVIWSRLQPIINTAHVVNGALVLGDVARADAAFVPLSLCRYAADHCRCRRARRSAAGSDAIDNREHPAHMKSTASAIPATYTRTTDLVALAKPRLNMLVVVSAVAGYVMASGDTHDVWRLLFMIVGTALVAGGASAFNQIIEREPDALMQRTRLRPMADGRLPAREAWVFGTVLDHRRAGDPGARRQPAQRYRRAFLTMASYTVVYTPLKRYSSFSTVVGAIPGALPPVIGWAAALDELSQGAWVLFGIVFLWQLPHFLAIAWIYREDYARAGFPMLPVVEPDGRSTARQAVIYALALLPVSLAPTLVGMTGPIYFAGALVLTLLFVGLAFKFSVTRTVPDARRLFFGSIIYLPLIWMLMIVDRT